MLCYVHKNDNLCAWEEHYLTTLSALLHGMKGYNTHSIKQASTSVFLLYCVRLSRVIVMLESFTLHVYVSLFMSLQWWSSWYCNFPVFYLPCWCQLQGWRRRDSIAQGLRVSSWVAVTFSWQVQWVKGLHFSQNVYNNDSLQKSQFRGHTIVLHCMGVLARCKLCTKKLFLPYFNKFYCALLHPSLYITVGLVLADFFDCK